MSWGVIAASFGIAGLLLALLWWVVAWMERVAPSPGPSRLTPRMLIEIGLILGLLMSLTAVRGMTLSAQRESVLYWKGYSEQTMAHLLSESATELQERIRAMRQQLLDTQIDLQSRLLMAEHDMSVLERYRCR